MMIGQKRDIEPPDEWLTWNEEGAWRQVVARKLRQDSNIAIGVQKIQDSRVSRWIHVAHMLDLEHTSKLTVGQGELVGLGATGEHPAAIVRFAAELHVPLIWQKIDEGSYTVIFNGRVQSISDLGHDLFLNSAEYTNSPLKHIKDTSTI